MGEGKWKIDSATALFFYEYKLSTSQVARVCLTWFGPIAWHSIKIVGWTESFRMAALKANVVLGMFRSCLALSSSSYHARDLSTHRKNPASACYSSAFTSLKSICVVLARDGKTGWLGHGPDSVWQFFPSF